MTSAARSTSRRATLALVLCAALAACSRHAPQHVSVGSLASATVSKPALAQPTMPLPSTVLASPIATATATATATAIATTAPTSSGSAAVVPTAAPSAVPTGTHILSIATTPTVVHDGDTVAWDVRTTSNVVDVLAHVTAYSFRFQRQAPGRFRLTFTIPKGVPGFFHGTYHMNVVARAGDGATDASTVAVVFE